MTLTRSAVQKDFRNIRMWPADFCFHTWPIEKYSGKVSTASEESKRIEVRRSSKPLAAGKKFSRSKGEPILIMKGFVVLCAAGDRSSKNFKRLYADEETFALQGTGAIWIRSFDSRTCGMFDGQRLYCGTQAKGWRHQSKKWKWFPWKKMPLNRAYKKREPRESANREIRSEGEKPQRDSAKTRKNEQANLP